MGEEMTEAPDLYPARTALRNLETMLDSLQLTGAVRFEVDKCVNSLWHAILLGE